MNTATKIFTAAALAILAAGGAQAETYQGVHAPVSANSRADIGAQAAIAARSGNPYAEGANAGVARAVVSVADRSAVRSEAVAAARSANPYSEGASASVVSIQASPLDRASVRNEARAASRGDALAL